MATALTKTPGRDRARARSLLLVAWMLLAIGAVTGLAWWDSRRESEAILADVGAEQSRLAAVIADDLGSRLAELGESDDPGRASRAAGFLRGLAQVAQHGPVAQVHDGAIFLAGPDATALSSSDGRVLAVSEANAGVRALWDAIEHGQSRLRLGRPESADLGLLARTSMAGIAYTDGGSPHGRWAVAAVATAARPRDREVRAIWRLILSVGLAGVLVLAFGGSALRNQRKELELERELAVSEVLRERDEHLARAERIATTGTFAMGIVHEVATPLGIITGRAEQLAGRANLDERGRNAALGILAQVDRIQQVTRRFLDMARGGPPSLATASPAEIVRKAAALVEHRFEKAGVRLETDVPNEMPEVQCDQSLLEQAIVNLMLNACDACSRGGHVELAAREDSARVAFVVVDDGVGITPENAARATEPFFTTKASGTGPGSGPGTGTGLGLAIAAEIAKSHRGALTILPNGDRGTRACIEIPAARS